MLEHDIQAQFFKDLEILQLKYPELEDMYAIPNGGKRSIGVAKKLKAEGVKPFIPDTHLPVPRGDFACLYIEFKRGGVNKTYLNKGQKAKRKRLIGYGNCVEVARSAGEGIAIVEEYLNL